MSEFRGQSVVEAEVLHFGGFVTDPFETSGVSA